MTASRSDMFLLSQDSTFQHRVQASLVSACINIQSESMETTPFHRERDSYVVSILSSISSLNDAVLRHSLGVATDSNVIADATVGGTVALTSGNAAAQAALVTDTHIDNAISGQFNTFFRLPA